MSGATDHMENAFNAASTLMSASSRISARIWRLARSLAVSMTKAGLSTRVQIELRERTRIAGLGLHLGGLHRRRSIKVSRRGAEEAEAQRASAVYSR